MNFSETCQKCGSHEIYEIHSGSVAEWLLNLAGCQPRRCSNCWFRWNQFFPLHIFFNLVYLLLAAEVGFLLWQYLP